MLLIPCPWCGPREETEFTCGGEAHIAWPRQPSALSDDQWAEYLFMRKNPKGVHHERWRHTLGCGRWFNAVRHTLSDEILAVHRMDEAPPRVDEAEASRTKAGRPRLTVVSDEPETPARGRSERS